MSFYQLMALKYGNRRTFSPESEGTSGGGSDAGAEGDADAGAGADADGAADAGNAGDAGQGGAGETRQDDPAVKTGKTDDEKAALLREVMDKKDKLKSTSKELADARSALDAYEGVDPAKVKELLRKEAEAEKNEAEARGDFERVKTMMADEHEKEMKRLAAERDAEREARAKDLSLIDELTIGNAFGNSDFIRDNMNISPVKARTFYGAHFERVDGAVVAYDKPAGAKDRTMLVNAKGEALSFDEALTRIVDADPDKKGLLKSRAKTGAGSSTDTDKGKTQTQAKLTGKAQIASILSQLE